MIAAATAREHLGLTSADDAALVVMIGGATAYLGHALNRYLGPPLVRVELKDGLGTDTVYLDHPITAAPETELSVEKRAGPFSTWVAVAAEDVVQEGQRVIGRSAWPEGRGTVRVIYEAGYQAEEGPAELRQLVLELVALRWREQGEESPKLAETLGDYSYTNGAVQALATWEATVAGWRRLAL